MSARVTDTQTSTLTGDEHTRPAPSAPRRRGTFGRRHSGADDGPLVREALAAHAGGLALASRRRQRVGLAVAVVALLAVLAVPIAASLPSSWFATALNRRLDEQQQAPYARVPASAQPVDERISIGDLGDAAEQYPPVGDLYFVTVMAPQQTLLSWLVGKDEPAVEFVTYEDVNGFQTPTQRRTLDLASMRTSEQVAQYVALQRVGYDVELVKGEVLIEGIVCLVEADDPADDDGCETWSPSDAVLDPGDEIVEIEGTAIATVDDLSDALAGRSPGDVVAMRIMRPDGDGGETELEVDVELTASPDDPGRTIVGFFPFDTSTVELPFELKIDTSTIGGPSAGLAFTLTLIDELTPGELTGGGRIAVTGTIELDGSVGAIGGLRQKASAVAQAGVEVFLVPASQSDADLAAARAAGGEGLEIITVATLDEALAVLAELGGDRIPDPPPAASQSGSGSVSEP